METQVDFFTTKEVVFDNKAQAEPDFSDLLNSGGSAPDSKTEEVKTEAQPVTEEVKETKPVEAPRIAAKLELLAQEERRFKQSMESEKQAFHSQKQEFETKYQEMQKAFEEGRNNPFEILKHFGFNNLDDLFAWELNNRQATPEQKEKQYREQYETRVKTLEERIADRERKEEELRIKSYNDQINSTLENVKTNVQTFLQNESASYPIINEEGLYDTVFDVLNAAVEKNQTQEDGSPVTYEWAANAVENYYKSKALKLASKYQTQATTPVKDTHQTNSIEEKPLTSKTLSNNTAIAHSGSSPDELPLDSEARLQALLKRARG